MAAVGHAGAVGVVVGGAAYSVDSDAGVGTGVGTDSDLFGLAVVVEVGNSPLPYIRGLSCRPFLEEQTSFVSSLAAPVVAVLLESFCFAVHLCANGIASFVFTRSTSRSSLLVQSMTEERWKQVATFLEGRLRWTGVSCCCYRFRGRCPRGGVVDGPS